MGVRRGKPFLQVTILLSHIGMLNEVISEKQPVPVLEMAFNHVNVVSPVTSWIPLDEPCIERGNISCPGSLQKYSYPWASRIGTILLLVSSRSVTSTNMSIMGLEAKRHRGAAEMLDPSNQVARQTSEEVLLLLLEHGRPSTIIGHNGHIFLHYGLDSLLE